MTDERYSQKMECIELLSHVQSLESMLPASSDAYFGHPQPPELHMIQLPSADRVYLGAAVTKRCVSAQIMGDNISKPPVKFLCLGGLEETHENEPSEEITCATLIVLDSAIKGSDTVTHGSIVVGTSFSRILCMEVQVEKDENGKPALHIGMPPLFEPLPLDSSEENGGGDDASVASMTSDASSRHGKRGRSDSFRDSQHSSPRRSASMSTSRHHESKNDSEHHKKRIDFCPNGGVTSVTPYRVSIKGDKSLVAVAWIAYGDGTTVRVHQGAFFSSVVHDKTNFEALRKAVLRSRVMLPLSAEGLTVLPLPKYHSSLLAPLPPWKPPRRDRNGPGSIARTIELTSDEDDDHEQPQDEEAEIEDLLTDIQEALVYGGDPNAAMGEQFPALAFYTSENQFVGRVSLDDLRERSVSSDEDASLLDHVIGGTAAVVGGVFGTALGVVKWGFGQGEKSPEDTPMSPDADMLDIREGEDDQINENVSPMYSALHSDYSRMFAGSEIHDSPRQITSVSVDPEGDLAATTDTLGRVLLVDLDTKQIVRVFKGFREASCAWIEIPRLDAEKAWQKKKILYLAIHSRQRRTVDIYRTRHGPRVLTTQIGRDAQLIQSSAIYDTGPCACCYLLHSSAPSASLNQLELLKVDDKSTGSSHPGAPAGDSSTTRDRSSSTHEAAMRLQLLQQLLAKTNVPTERQDVFEALTQITSLKDLCMALDVLAVSSQLEDAMGVIGSEFHSAVVAHCKQTLDDVIREGGQATVENAQVKLLASRVAFHTQLVEAYDELHEFETKTAVDDDKEERVAPRSPWAVEAMAWLTMYETVTGTSVDASVIEQTRPVLPFWAFAKSCSDSKKVLPAASGQHTVRHSIHLTDSTKSRKVALVHIFKPLLRDIFAFNVVSSIFKAMGIEDDTDYLLKCFGDWFLCIPSREAARKGLFGLHSPMVRWLQDMVASEIDSRITGGDLVEGENLPLLPSLFKFCSEATDMARAFLLATLCREAVSIATKKKEAKTYGKISTVESVKPWNDLLRKIRICLLVSLRLNRMNLGAFPITVSNVDAKDIFSVYEWCARDELTMSHTHEEIVSLETACRCSGLVFDPSSEVGDRPQCWKMLQQACLAAAISEEEREEFLLDMNDDDQLGALLLYLSQYNNPAILVAHRALLLARQWVQKPSDLQSLQDCLSALIGLHDDDAYKALSFAVRVEVWHSAIRPFYRAVFFGFDDVHELTEEVAGPLLDNREWLRGFGKVALPILKMLSESTWDDSMNTFEVEPPANNTSWPPVKDDFILKRMVQASKPVSRQAIDIHRVIVCGTLVSDDLGALSDAVPELYECFTPTSLFHSADTGMENTDKQMEFLEQAVIDRANELEEGIPGRLEIGDIEELARLWDVDLKDIRTLFMLAMYELGKDTLVDESLSSCNSSNLDVERFVSDGLGIACRRLNRILNVKRSHAVKSIMGMLDADTCEWVREQAEDSMSLLEGDDGDSRVSMANTHLLILRILGLCTTIKDKSQARKIHSLSILSGTLLKALERQD